MKLSFHNIQRILNDPRYELTNMERQKLINGQYSVQINTRRAHEIVFA